MNVKFSNRALASQFPPNVLTPWSVVRYSWNMVGGPDKAVLNAPLTVDKWDAFKLLRCGVEIFDRGRCVWWGYVHKITIPHGDLKVGLSMDNLYNSVAVTYSELETASTVSSGQAMTAYATDLMSIAEFGTKQYMLSISNATPTQAAYQRDVMLGTNKYPIATVDMGSGKQIEIECRGWWDTLAWKYYSNTSTVVTETTAQIAAIIASAGQFITQTQVMSASGIFTNPYRENIVNSLTEVESLLKGGTTAGKRLLATVTRDRSVLINEIPAQAARYFMDQGGKLVWPANKQLLVEPPCLVGVWVGLKDVPLVLGGLTTVKEFFIESAEYNVQSGKTNYKPLGQADTLAVTRIA